MKLWSLRNTTSRGYVWHKERDVSEDNAARWLLVYANDEPGVEFRVAPTKPKLPAALPRVR